MAGILLTLAFSLIISLVGHFTGGNFIRWFVIATVAQLVVFFIYNQYITTRVQMHLNELEVERLNKIDENRVTIKCAVCGEPETTVIRLSDKNEFRCKKCNSLNVIDVKISNIQKTEFIDGLITQEVLEKLKKESEIIDERDRTISDKSREI